MKRVWMMVLLVNLLLSACAPVTGPTPAPSATPMSVAVLAPTSTATPTATATPSPTPTDTATPSPTPSPTATATPTPIPTLPPEQVGGLTGVPDPRVTNPELFSLTRRDAPIPQFVNAMKKAGIEVSAEEVLSSLEFISTKADGTPLLDKDGKPFIVAAYNFDPDPNQTGETLEGPIPLFIATQNENGEWGWRNYYNRISVDTLMTEFGCQIVSYKLNDPKYTKEITQFGNLVTIDGEFSFSVLGRGKDLKQLINQYVQIKNSGQEPNPDTFFDWRDADKVIIFANQNSIIVRMHHIFSPGEITEEFFSSLQNGEITWGDFESFLEFYTKSIATRYNGSRNPNLVIHQFSVANEIAAHSLWAANYQKDILSRMLRNGTLAKLFIWLNEANPQAKLILNEDHLLEKEEGNLRNKYMEILSILKRQGAPVTLAGFQNHLWVYRDLSPLSEINNFLGRIRNLGVEVASTETTISVSHFNAVVEGERVDPNTPPNFSRQINYARTVLSLFPSISFFGLTDSVSMFNDIGNLDAQALPLDAKYQPRALHYVILQYYFKLMISSH